MDIAFDEVVVEDLFFDRAFAVMGGKEFFEFGFFFGVGINQRIGLEDFEGFLFVFISIEFALSTGNQDFVEEVGDRANDISFGNIGGGDVNGFFKDFEEVFAVIIFFFIAEVGISIEGFGVDFDGFKVVFDHFASSIFTGGLVGEVGF